MAERHYFIVGGSAGIGLEIARRLARDGAAVFVGSRTRGALAEIDPMIQIPMDAARDPLVLDGLPERLDGLAYCPGSIRLKPFARLTAEDFLQDLQVNFLGAVRVLQACLPRLKASAEGAAVVLFSTVAVGTGMPFHASIAAAKGAVEGLTRSLAAELAPRIRVNAVAPSLTDTALAAPLIATDEKRQAAAERHPLKRIGTVEDIAALAVLLLSGAGRWITGQVLHVDGGMGALRVFR